MGTRAVFPGSFDPLTVAHLAIADAVVEQLEATRVDLVVSVEPLAKAATDQSPAHERIEAIRRLASVRPWLDATVTTDRLLADIAEGYDLLVIGADKWHQLIDARFYGGSIRRRDAALERLPQIALAPRTGIQIPDDRPDDLVILEVDPRLHPVSSTAVRQGRTEWRA